MREGLSRHVNTDSMNTPLVIDGSTGEGGGQILRTALGLSLASGRPLRAVNIRAKRRKPGLMRQHLTAVTAAAAISDARVEGARAGATELSFTPGPVVAGEHRFSVGTAGSTTLVLQAVLPALLCADGPSTLELEGGTHNPMAPCFDFIERAFVPLLARMGAEVRVELERPGFYPAGGGRMRVHVQPCARWTPLELEQRGATVAKRARVLSAHLRADIAKRELRVLARRLNLRDDELHIEPCADAPGPGNACLVELESEHVTEVFAAYGEQGRRAESVARDVVGQVHAYLADDAPVGAHLADQLLIPMALADAGSFRTGAPTPHTRTNIEVIERCLPVRFDLTELHDGTCRVSVAR